MIAGMSDLITRSRLASTCSQLHKRNYLRKEPLGDWIIDRPGTYHLTKDVHCRYLRLMVPNITLEGYRHTVFFLPDRPLKEHIILLMGYDPDYASHVLLWELVHSLLLILTFVLSVTRRMLCTAFLALPTYLLERELLLSVYRSTILLKRSIDWLTIRLPTLSGTSLHIIKPVTFAL